MPEMVSIILAAGKGTRMKSKLPKALHPICGKAMALHVIDACKDSGISDCIVVIGHGADQVREGLGEGVRYAIQEEQLGTGDACKRGVELLQDDDVDVLVTPGDTPLVTAEILDLLAKAHRSSGADATLLTAILDQPGSYGRVVRTVEGGVLGIVENKDATPKQREIREINAAMYCFKLKVLRKYLASLTNENAQSEYYLTDVIGKMSADGLKVQGLVSPDADVVRGINDRVDLADLTEILRKRVLRRQMLAGVTIVDPSSTYIDSDVEIGLDTTIYPHSILENGTRIGDNCSIGPSVRLYNVKIGNEVTVFFSNAADSLIGDGSKVGPFAHIRPGCRLGQNVKMGDFVEAKNAVLEDGVSMGHLAYVGDAVIGEHTNIGAGVITCNYDGVSKHRTVVGQDVFLGSDVTLVAPISIGDGAFIAAGSTVTENVSGGALAIARCRQTTKEGWAKKRREERSGR
ncbi:MAG TPA: bifunctional UDP-N-acetylglucosamine diphosphorylase/glucosamine-1-phosphate N-acetyltransferase GlmU [Armatimonadota bacterium]